VGRSSGARSAIHRPRAPACSRPSSDSGMSASRSARSSSSAPPVSAASRARLPVLWPCRTSQRAAGRGTGTPGSTRRGRSRSGPRARAAAGGACRRREAAGSPPPAAATSWRARRRAAGRRSSRPGEHDLGAAAQRRPDQLRGGPLGVHGRYRHAVGEGEPAVRGGAVAGEQGVARRAGAPQAGTAVVTVTPYRAASTRTQTLGETDGGVRGRDVGQQRPSPGSHR
jgi:hypothetical protein